MSQRHPPNTPPRGREYMPSLPPLEPEGVAPFSDELREKFIQYLETKPPRVSLGFSPAKRAKRHTNNYSIFSQAKKVIYQH